MRACERKAAVRLISTKVPKTYGFFVQFEHSALVWLTLLCWPRERGRTRSAAIAIRDIGRYRVILRAFHVKHTHRVLHPWPTRRVVEEAKHGASSDRCD